MAGTEARVRVDAVNSNGAVTGFTALYGGYDYETGISGFYNATNISGSMSGSSFKLRPETIETVVGTTATGTAVLSNSGTITSITITNPGSGYTKEPHVNAPVVTISNAPEFKDPSTSAAVGIASIGIDGTTNVVKSILIEDAGKGYTQAPVVTIADPEALVGIGTFQFNEIVTGSRSFLRARVKEWDVDTLVLKVSNVGTSKTAPDGKFFPGETIIGETSGARYVTNNYVQDDTYDKYTENDEFETLGDSLIDFSESNPFGTF